MMATYWIATPLIMLGEWQRALAYLRQSLAYGRRVQSQMVIARRQALIAMVASAQADWHQGRSLTVAAALSSALAALPPATAIATLNKQPATIIPS
jgi:hypothetical protein